MLEVLQKLSLLWERRLISGVPELGKMMGESTPCFIDFCLDCLDFCQLQGSKCKASEKSFIHALCK